MADNTERSADIGTENAAPAASDRATDRAARFVREFAAAHGGTAEGHLAYLGERGYRLVLVGADGTWGDQVAPRRETLTSAAERAGVPLSDAFDGELAARVRTGPSEWVRAAGRWVGA